MRLKFKGINLLCFQEEENELNKEVISEIESLGYEYKHTTTTTKNKTYALFHQSKFGRRKVIKWIYT